MTRDDDQATTSTKPYLIRALHEWCTDNGFAPHLAVRVDGAVRVPGEFVRNGEIVLNVGYEATSALKLGNEYIEFKARFGGVARDVVVPVTHVLAIYARENGQGMAFPPPSTSLVGAGLESVDASSDDGDGLGGVDVESATLRSVPSEVFDDGITPPPAGPAAPGGRPQLKRVK